MKPNPGICKGCKWCKKKCIKLEPVLHEDGLYTATGIWDYFCTGFVPIDKRGLFRCSELKECICKDNKNPTA